MKPQLTEFKKVLKKACRLRNKFAFRASDGSSYALANSLCRLVTEVKNLDHKIFVLFNFGFYFLHNEGMKSAPLHPQEKARLESLKALEILDTLPEKDFDDITLIASQICSTPVSLISLVDEDRQWFKSAVGVAAQQTPREWAFCAYAILQDQPFVVKDALSDDRFADNPLVAAAPHVRFYAGVPLKSPEGMPIGTLCVIDSKSRDLTDAQMNALSALSNQVGRLLELKVQLKKLQESQKKLEIKNVAIENISEGIVLQDSTGTICDFNPAAAELLGMSANQLRGKTFLDSSWRIVRADGSPLPGAEHPAMACLQTGKIQSEIEMGVYIKANQLRWLRARSVPLFTIGTNAVSHVVTSLYDITSFRRAEAHRRAVEMKLSEAARLATLGDMASGIAHEINNPLAIILGKANLLKSKLESHLDFKNWGKDFQIIEDAVHRVAKIIKGLRLYARSAENDPFEIQNVATLLSETLDLCKMRFRAASIEIQVTCDPNLTVECRAAQLSQLMMNLLTNSYDAIFELPERWVRIEVSQEQNSLITVVTDSGPGLPVEILDKIMNPFFTTKEVGKGTGLGLSISKGIAEIHGGTFKYIPGLKNTTFVLQLPIVQERKKRA